MAASQEDSTRPFQTRTAYRRGGVIDHQRFGMSGTSGSSKPTNRSVLVIASTQSRGARLISTTFDCSCTCSKTISRPSGDTSKSRTLTSAGDW